MKTDNSIKRLEKETEDIRRELLRLGPIHPGSISQQYHACGNPACRCHHPTKPEKHGPYNKLTYAYGGKTVCRFVHPAHVKDVETRLTAYKTFRALIDRWVALSIERGMVDFFASSGKPRRKSSRRAN